MKKYLASALIGLAVIIGAASIQAASTWTAPSTAAPGGNADAPINVGLNSQSKLGQLLVNTDISNPFTVGLDVWGKTILNGGLQVGSASAITPGSVLTAANANGDATWQAGANGSYDFAFVVGSPTYNFPFVCRILISSGYTECKQSKTVLSSWTSVPSPFAASTPGVYSLMCIPGASQLNFPACCRTNSVTGTTECKQSQDLLASWISASSPF